jgi:hypothetical protein
MSVRLIVLTSVLALLVGIVVSGPVGSKSEWGIVITPCAWCGATNDIQVHHIYPQHLYPARAHDTNNMVCLCPRCHLVLGHRGCFTNAVTNLIIMIREGKK